MNCTAVYWVIFTLTYFSFILRLTVFATQFSSFLLSLLGGIVSDRYNRRKTLLLTQCASMMVQAILLAIFDNQQSLCRVGNTFLKCVAWVTNAFDVPLGQP